MDRIAARNFSRLTTVWTPKTTLAQTITQEIRNVRISFSTEEESYMA
jgi:hypothetical protein